MAAVTTALIRLYPRAWRQRYGDEMRELLAGQRLSVRTLADLVAGAIDARLDPQLKPARRNAAPNQGVQTMTRRFACAPAGISVQDQWRSAAWMLGGSVVLTLLGIALKRKIGPNALSEGLLYSAFPAALMLSSECTYLKGYSRAARMVIAAGGAISIVLMIWAAVAIGYLI